MNRDEFELERLRSAVTRYADLEERVSRMTLRFALASVCFVVVVLGLYATTEVLTGTGWSGLRRLVMWLMPLYLLLTVASVFVGLYSAWGATNKAVARRGGWACGVAIGSIVLLLVGRGVLTPTL